jgi:hypothetical protein
MPPPYSTPPSSAVPVRVTRSAVTRPSNSDTPVAVALARATA